MAPENQHADHCGRRDSLEHGAGPRFVEILCSNGAFDKVSAALEAKGIKPESPEIIYLPTSTVPVPDLDAARSFFKLQSALEELDDVQNVFSNEDISESLAQQVQEA